MRVRTSLVAPVGRHPADDLRVALFSGNYNCIRDGANNALNRLGRFLLDQGAAFRVYSPTSPRPAFAPAGDLVSIASIPIPGRTEYRLALGLGKTARADMRRFNPTIVHLSAPDILGRQAQRFARTLKIPVVASLHTRFETYFEYYRLGAVRGMIERYLQRFYSDCDLVLAPNQGMAEILESWGLGGRIRIWSRGVDQALFSPHRRDPSWRRAQGYADDELVLLFFGRLVPEKGLATFAELVAKLRAGGRRLRPLVVGAGPGLPFLAARLGDAVFTGHLEGEALARAVASADILVNPSETEAFGNVNLEAMASGLAVVSADGPSARGVLDDQETGWLVPARDVAAYADAIEVLAGHPLRRRAMASAAVRRSADFDWPATLAPVVDAYREAARLSAAAGSERMMAAGE